MNEVGLVDSHLHLQAYDSYVGIGSVITESESAGVTRFVCNGTCEEDLPKVLDMAQSYPQIIPCFGLHPWFVSERSNDWISVLEGFLQRVPSGVGEIGLDKCVDNLDRELQEHVLRVQLGLARKHNRPAMIHCVRSWGWLMDVLRSEPELPSGMLFHSYSGSVDLIKPLVKLGAYFTFSGNVLQDNFERATKSIVEVPLDRLLIESDAPYMLPPEQFRTRTVTSSDGKELNHPANLPVILEGIAGLRGVTPDDLRTTLWENSQRLFGPLI